MLPSPSDFIRRPSDRFGRTKWLIRPLSRTLEAIRPLPFSLFARRSLLSLPQRSNSAPERMTESKTARARRWSSEPRRRRRPPRRRACSPAGEHATVERPGRSAPLTEPGEQLPRSALLLPRRRKAGSGGFLLPSLSPSPSSFRFGCSSLVRTDVGNRDRVRGFVCRPPFLFFFLFSEPESSSESNRDLGLGFGFLLISFLFLFIPNPSFPLPLLLL